jgi:hypothetical protein
MEENIFVDEELQGFEHDEDEPTLPSISSPELVPTSTLETEAPQATTPSTVVVDASRVEGGSSPSREPPLNVKVVL